MNELIQLGRETFEFGSRGLARLNRRLLAMDASSPGKPLLQKINRKRMEGMQRAKGRKPARAQRQAIINSRDFGRLARRLR